MIRDGRAKAALVANAALCGEVGFQNGDAVSKTFVFRQGQAFAGQRCGDGVNFNADGFDVWQAVGGAKSCSADASAQIIKRACGALRQGCGQIDGIKPRSMTAFCRLLNHDFTAEELVPGGLLLRLRCFRVGHGGAGSRKVAITH